MHNFLLRYYVAEARAEPGHRHPDPRGAAARDGGQPARRQHRRLPRPGPLQPARGVRGGRLHPHPDQGAVERPPLLRLRHQRRVHPEEPQQLRRAVPRGAHRGGHGAQAREPRADRQGHLAGGLPEPARDGGAAGADRQVRRRPGQGAERARPHRLRPDPVAEHGRVDADADEALGLRQGRRRLQGHRREGVPAHRREEDHEGAGPDAARRRVPEVHDHGQGLRSGEAGRLRRRASPWRSAA